MNYFSAICSSCQLH